MLQVGGGAAMLQVEALYSMKQHQQAMHGRAPNERKSRERATPAEGSSPAPHGGAPNERKSRERATAAEGQVSSETPADQFRYVADGPRKKHNVVTESAAPH